MHPQRTKCAARRHPICRRAAILLLSGLPLLAPAMPVFAKDAVLALASQDQRFGVFIAEASSRFNIPESWIRAVLHAESEHVDDVSSAGAMGLMQIMPDTWTELRARYGLGVSPFDPHDNIVAGTAYLRELLDRYGNIGAMLAAYNAGPKRYDDYLATARPLPVETRNYVAKLAPILGGASLPGITVSVPLQPIDWRDAPLFVMPVGGSSSAGSLQPDRRSAASAPSTSTSGDDATSSSTGGIFVTISGRSSGP